MIRRAGTAVNACARSIHVRTTGRRGRRRGVVPERLVGSDRRVRVRPGGQGGVECGRGEAALVARPALAPGGPVGGRGPTVELGGARWQHGAGDAPLPAGRSTPRHERTAAVDPDRRDGDRHPGGELGEQGRRGPRRGRRPDPGQGAAATDVGGGHRQRRRWRRTGGVRRRAGGAGGPASGRPSRRPARCPGGPAESGAAPCPGGRRARGSSVVRSSGRKRLRPRAIVGTGTRKARDAARTPVRAACPRRRRRSWASGRRGAAWGGRRGNRTGTWAPGGPPGSPRPTRSAASGDGSACAAWPCGDRPHLGRLGTPKRPGAIPALHPRPPSHMLLNFHRRDDAHILQR